MPEERARLSQKDIERLLNDRSSEAKIEVIDKLAYQYNRADFTESQLRMAEQIFRLLLRAAEVAVRQSLARNLASNSDAPRDVILALARDVEEVALPILEFSEVLTDNDLIELIRSTEEVAKHTAVASRRTVSSPVSNALIDTRNSDVVDHLLHNQGAQISEDNFVRMVDSFADNERIVDSMITRGALPPAVIARMTQKVSATIQKKLEEKHGVEFGEINKVFRESGEIAALKFMGMQQVDRELMNLVDDLEKHGQLEKSLASGYGMLTQLLDGIDQLGNLNPISTLACGNLVLFCVSLSRLTGVPYPNVKKLVDDREGGLKALYERAALPEKLAEAVYLTVGVIQDMDEAHRGSGAARARDDLGLMVRKIMEASKGKKVANMAHFIAIIQHHVEADQSEW